MTTPTILPKPKTNEQEELPIPQHSIAAFHLPGFSELQKARENTRQIADNLAAKVREEIREENQQHNENTKKEVQRHNEKTRRLTEILQNITDEKPIRARRPSMPREELERGILAALKTGEQSGSAIAESLQVDPNRVTALLDEMVKAKKVAHTGVKKASRFSLSK